MLLTTPLTDECVEKLEAGEIVYLTGIISTVRDKAHERALRLGKFPIDLKNGVIFHSGPIVKKEKDEWVIIAIGPTTSSRMNSLEPEFIERFNIRAVIGKGGMNEGVMKSMRENRSVYLSMTGGCAASIAEMVKEVRGVYWLDLGIPEAIWVLRVEKFGPLIVSIDAKGNSLYEEIDKRVQENLKGISE
ncbi:MAG: fumarate hydratase [Candidatus Altiarchaeales archaeon]|nr:MAG: fumarate hydratase [Candidatus Altiarchaeales archaeon]